MIYRQQYLYLRDIVDQRMNFRLPKYQRGYVWSPEQARFLVETMLLGLPIGSMILWDRLTEVLVIDGQQRLSTLRGVFLGQGRGEVHTICVQSGPDGPEAVVGTGPGRVPVAAFLRPNRLRYISAAAAGLDPSKMSTQELVLAHRSAESDAEAMDNLSDAETRLAYTQIPSLVFDHSATREQVKESFRRINLGGTPITPEQLADLLNE